MAEGSRGGERKESSNQEEEDSVKLFVGQVPKHMTEPQLLTMFQEFALVDEVNIIRDKTTRASRGVFFFFFFPFDFNFNYFSLFYVYTHLLSVFLWLCSLVMISGLIQFE